MIVKKDIKKYIGAVESEEKAARYYDKYALIIQGFDAKTNFSYTKSQMEELILSNDEEQERLEMIER
jgi:hypothetical protein